MNWIMTRSVRSFLTISSSLCRNEVRFRLSSLGFYKSVFYDQLRELLHVALTAQLIFELYKRLLAALQYAFVSLCCFSCITL